MKKKMSLFALIGAMILAGCSASEGSPATPPANDSEPVASEQEPVIIEEAGEPSEEPAEEPVAQENLYRGVVKEASEGRVLLAQVEGRDYGFAEMMVNLPEQEESFAEGDYVEIHHDGRMTRSIPPQVTAVDVRKLMEAQAMVLNGVVSSLEQNGGSNVLSVRKIVDGQETDEEVMLTYDDTVIQVDGLDLTPGAKVSAFTRGIMTMSLPPQCPVTELAAYTFEG